MALGTPCPFAKAEILHLGLYPNSVSKLAFSNVHGLPLVRSALSLLLN